jgi:outer membrane protein assembly factor BamB
VIYFGDLDSTFYAVDESCEEKWRVETKGWVWGGPLVHEDTVIFGDMAGKVYALDTTDNGSQRWVFEAEGGVRVTPLLVDDSSEQSAGGLLYFGTRKGNVYAISVQDGIQKWAQSLNGAVYSQPVIRGGYLFVSPHNAKEKLVALDPEGLAIRWSYPSREE